ncbi:MAG: hypothetical protein AB7O92_19310 [Acidimicrobiia bacterium]
MTARDGSMTARRHPLDLVDVLATARTHAAAGAAANRLYPAVVAQLGVHRLGKLFLPASLGGHDLSLPEACEVLSEVAEADGAAGWAVMIGTGPNWFAGHMDDALAAAVFGPAHSFVAGSGKVGRAERVAGGHRVSGTWHWCSGAPWATWFTFLAQEAGEGAAPPFAIAVPAAEVAIDEASWRSRGLAATASCNAMLDGTFVPDGHRFHLDPSGPRRDEPIFRVPFAAFAEATMAAVALGIGRRLLGELAALARSKVPSFATDVLAHQAVAQDRFARATASLRSAESWWRSEVARLWEAAASGGGTAEPAMLVDHQLACVHAAQVVAGAANALEPLAGMDALPVDDALGRVLADARAAGRNAVIAEARFADAGAALLR